MTTPHNSAVPRRKNPLHSSSHCKNFVAASLDKLVTALDFSTRRCFQPSHKFVLSQSALYALLHTLLSSIMSPNQLFWQPFWGCRLQSASRSSAGWSGLPRSYPGAIRVHAGWFSGLFPRLHFLRRSLSGRRLAPKPDVAGALRTRHNPASQRLRRSSVSRIGGAAAREAASCEQSFFGKRSTDGAIVAKRRSVRFTCSTSRKPGVRHAVHRQE